ncbi:MAG: hypothetical protein WAL52_23760 [Candidatus Sulfotelmatobacter sp.]
MKTKKFLTGCEPILSVPTGVIYDTLGLFSQRRIICLPDCAIPDCVIDDCATGSNKSKSRGKDPWFNIDAKNVWLDTGLTIPKGDLVHVYGGVLACTVLSPQRPHLPLPSAPVGVLLMKLHAEDKPVLASPDGELPAMDNASRLYLGVNGWQCCGKLPARVHIEKPQP